MLAGACACTTGSTCSLGMIASLLAFVLFPLSQFLHSLADNTCENDHLQERKSIAVGESSEMSDANEAHSNKNNENAGKKGVSHEPVYLQYTMSGDGFHLMSSDVPQALEGKDKEKKSNTIEQQNERDLRLKSLQLFENSDENLQDDLQLDWSFGTQSREELVDSLSWQIPSMTSFHLLEQEVKERQWEDLTKTWSDFYTQKPSNNGCQIEFTVMSYNILSQNLLEANPTLYAHCPIEVLSWNIRLHNLLQEFRMWDPDILCLQEAQEDHYQEEIEPTLVQMGYKCIYKRRTGNKKDGCALCYKTSKFDLISSELVEFLQPSVEVLDRDNVGIVALFQGVVPSDLKPEGRPSKASPICVANTHLLFSPRRGDIKLAQVALLMAEIDLMIRPWREKGASCPVIVCGDFNCIPRMPLYQFIVTGQLYYHGLPAWMISGQEDLSHKFYQRKLYTPLWPQNLGITDRCQYVTSTENKSDNRIYSHCFMRGLRYSPPACIRPEALEFIPGVTDARPVPPENWFHDKSADVDSKVFFPRIGGTLYHNLNLKSVHSHFDLETGKPEVTSLHTGLGATVDYIFYSAEPVNDPKHGGRRQLQDGPLKLLGRLTLFSEEDLWAMNGLPNKMYSSDHLCLLAKFCWDTIYF
ncbi:protein angel homolog 1 isoform X2 [Polypterus senegalus]|uniref:protein angel homolog 1 isoform X2 n=1 Tax=Polypterus senegalus TaxID=55291 RepID=UPI0019641D87|nr:protein angel homolog 1 isoform X2 [Polypterus senegalus]